jgi:arylamine N-acetyltransferase
METAILFNHMLRALGFPAYLVGARIRPRINNIPQGDVYTGWVHLVNIVTIPGSAAAAAGGVNYALDVGFGGDGMTVPMPLAEGVVHHNSIGTQEIRLVREFISNQRFRGEGARQWVYQVRNGGEGGPAEWVAFFAFHDGFEFTEEDFGVVNWYTSRAAESPQMSTPLAIRFVRGKGADGRVRVVGKVMMVKGVVKENLTGKTRLVRECKTEAERVEALRELFGICLTEEEALSIRGLATELVGEV